MIPDRLIHYRNGGKNYAHMDETGIANCGLLVTNYHHNVTCPKCLAILEKAREKRPNHHIIDGEFQSDKYPWCKPGFVPLKISDGDARDLLLKYAERRGRIDKDFGDDLIDAITDQYRKDHA